MQTKEEQKYKIITWARRSIDKKQENQVNHTRTQTPPTQALWNGKVAALEPGIRHSQPFRTDVQRPAKRNAISLAFVRMLGT